MFHSFFQLLCKVKVFFFLFTIFSIILYGQPSQQSPLFSKFSFFLWLLSGLVVWLRLGDLFICQNPRELCECHSPGQMLGCIYHFFGRSNLNFLLNSQWITFPTHSYLVLYSFNANLLHSLIMWLMVSSLSPHNLHLLFCCVLSILALIWLIFIAVFYAAIKRNLVSLLSFPFPSLVHVFWCEISLISPLKRP